MFYKELEDTQKAEVVCIQITKESKKFAINEWKTGTNTSNIE